MITPHGGSLVDRVLTGERREAALERAATLPSVTLTSVAASDLELIGNGAFSPLTGFMGEADYRSVVDDLHLADGTLWSIPITLSVSREVADTLSIGGEVALADEGGRILGILELAEKYTYDREHEAAQVFRTTEEAHPGVARIYSGGEVYLGGEVWVLNGPADPPFAAYRRTPAEVRALIAERGWRRVVGFQTRNPIHRAHEYLTKVALEIVDGLLVHPLVGDTKSDDIPADVRMRAYEALLHDYYPEARTLLSVYPAAMRYGGPREAIFHAIARKNYGCTHFIVGRDHAGVGNYYGTYDAQRIFDDISSEDLGITPLFFEHTFWCNACKGMASYKTCPHGESDHLILSGTRVRAMLSSGEMPPPEFSRPEVAQILIEAYRSNPPAI
ncbi:MAG TPA: sulfate adenylyltransferase [candidate division Zixibacteria bacterium]|nr:sulfate adenylyltransferase [candidate division Zixibacteria bacterium]